MCPLLGRNDDLILLFQSYRELKYLPGELYTWNMFLEKVSLHDLCKQLTTSAFQEGLPKDKDLQDPSIAHIFSVVLHNGFVIKSNSTSEDDWDALQSCFCNGWLRTDTLRDIGQPEEVSFAFASPLHRWFVEWKLSNAIPEITSKFIGLSI